jgi:hypothetical protein
MKRQLVFCKGLVLLAVFLGSVVSANVSPRADVPFNVLVKGGNLGKGRSPSNLLHLSDGSSAIASAAFCGAVAAASGCVGWLFSGSALGGALSSVSVVASGAISSYLDRRPLQVFLGSYSVELAPENEKYVTLLRALLSGRDLRLTGNKEGVIRRPDVVLIGKFTDWKVPVEGKEAKPQYLRVAELSSVEFIVGEKTYPFKELEVVPPDAE